MRHLILLMPVLALPIFRLMPPSLSIPIFIVIVGITAFLYQFIAGSMGEQPATGQESLIGVAGEVLSTLGSENHAWYLVRSQGELWRATSPDVLQTGEMVNIVDVEGIRLVVKKNGHLFTTKEKAVKKSRTDDLVEIGGFEPPTSAMI